MKAVCSSQARWKSEPQLCAHFMQVILSLSECITLFLLKRVDECSQYLASGVFLCGETNRRRQRIPLRGMRAIGFTFLIRIFSVETYYGSQFPLCALDVFLDFSRFSY